MYGGRGQRPLGMQIHAVPEGERYQDTETGRIYPWGYDKAVGATENGDRPTPIEKGPFGRSMRRSRSGASRSRSKTVEPKGEKEKMTAENIAAEDAVFGSLRRMAAKDDGKREQGDADASAGQSSAAARIPAATESDSEPTEILLYGFGEELQWAAIDFYERVSNGWVLEDYDRQPPGQRYDISRSLGRQAAQKSLSRAAMRKKNKYAGGEHWIKVTFDSQRASELAMARSPHIIKGYLVYAEQYSGRGPQKDEPFYATQAGAQITSETLPPTFTTTQPLNGSPNGSSTVSSATATAPNAAGARFTAQNMQDSPTASSATMRSNNNSRAPVQTPSGQATGIQPPQGQLSQPQTRRARIEGAIRANVLPAELALAPKQPKASWTSWIGYGDVIGSTLPRKEDGTFDWDNASLYWRLFWWIDSVFGTDLCGLKYD